MLNRGTCSGMKKFLGNILEDSVQSLRTSGCNVFANLLVDFRGGHFVFKTYLFYLASMENLTFAGEVDFYTNTFQSCSIYTPMLRRYKYRYKYNNVT